MSRDRALTAYAFQKTIHTDALLILHNGHTVYERYTAPTNATTPHLTWSISKSVLATVLGVAHAQGRFTLDDPAARFYSPMREHPSVRMVDLLHWASGLDWQEDYEYAPLKSSVVAMLYTRGRGDMAAYTANREAAVAPGERFLYSSGDSNLLSATLRGMLGKGEYEDYPWHALFEPLGIDSAIWERDASGTFVGSSYLYMNARDLARIGQLMLQDGRWENRQLLSADWVAFNRQPFGDAPSETGEPVPGAHWWLNRALNGGPQPWPDAPPDTFAALGHWGQALYVIPSQGLVIVRYADDREPGYSHNDLLRHAIAAFGKEQP